MNVLSYSLFCNMCLTLMGYCAPCRDCIRSTFWSCFIGKFWSGSVYGKTPSMLVLVYGMDSPKVLQETNCHCCNFCHLTVIKMDYLFRCLLLCLDVFLFMFEERNATIGHWKKKEKERKSSGHHWPGCNTRINLCLEINFSY